MTTEDTRYTPDGRLSAEDHELARLLGRGMTYTDAGEILGLSETTVYRRMRDLPELRHAVDHERAAGVDGVLHQLAMTATKSLEYLANVVEDDTEPTPLRVKAAVEVLGHFRGSVAVTLDRAREERARRDAEGDAVRRLVTHFHTSIRTLEDLEILPIGMPGFPLMVAAFAAECSPSIASAAEGGDFDGACDAVVAGLTKAGAPKAGAETVAAAFRNDLLGHTHPVPPRLLRLSTLLGD